MKKIYILFLLTFAFMNAQENKNLIKETNQKTVDLSSKSVQTEQALKLFSKEFNLDNSNTFKSTTTSKDETGRKHEKFQQYFKGYEVVFGTAIAHSINGFVYKINGELYNANNLELNPVISETSAFNIALNKTNAQSYLWEDEEQSRIMDYAKPKGDLVIFPDVLNNTIHFAYKFDVYASNPISRNEIYVDAKTGKVLFSNPIIKHANRLLSSSELKNNIKELEETILVNGSAATRYSGTKSIETTLVTSNYTLRDLTRGSGIFTYNCQRRKAYQDLDFTDADNNWIEYNNVSKDNGALDAHWGAEKTYDFWKNIFGRNSYDNNNAAIKSYVHYDRRYDNAFWNGTAMTYGDGTNFDILTSIDICGHEIGHAICTYTANLAYKNQSGAMNEGFSDIWGACVEHYGRTGSISGTPVSNVWAIGEDIISGGLRSMSNPLSKGDPDTYLGTNWRTTADEGTCVPDKDTNDYCGVHSNSGVLNHWFYILSAGKSGTNNAPIPDTYNVTGIGMEKAAKIAYYAERDYLTPNSTFADARIATIAVASSLYCAISPEVVAVTNAWYAVNVGDQYVAAANDVSLESISASSLIECSSSTFNTMLKIKNQGTNSISSVSISYTIDSSSSVNTSWTGSLSSCSEFDYPLTISDLTRGSHILSVTTTITNDGRSENNTKSVKLLVNDSGVVGVTNTFTDTNDALIIYDQDSSTKLWQRGVNANGSMSSSGNTVYTTNLTGNYPDETKSYIVSQCYNLSNVSSPSISFAMKYDLELNWDIVYVEYSTNFGADWTVLGTMGTNWYNSDRTSATAGNDCYNCPGAQWTGTNFTNQTYTYPLTSLIGETNVIFRIVFHSDQAENLLGVTIDDFVINGVLSSSNFELNKISVYPNPSKGVFNISLGNVEPTSIEVYDLMGKQITMKQKVSISNSEATIDLTNASQGVYFVKISVDGEQIVKRIIKQ